MRTKEEILQAIVGDIEPEYFDVTMDSDIVKEAMSEYAKEVVSELIAQDRITDKVRVQKWMETI